MNSRIVERIRKIEQLNIWFKGRFTFAIGFEWQLALGVKWSRHNFGLELPFLWIDFDWEGDSND
jgi:hypothetical protein